jgi:hypothetical protein
MHQTRRASPADADIAASIVRTVLADYGLPLEPNGRDADVRLFGARTDHEDFVAASTARLSVSSASALTGTKALPAADTGPAALAPAETSGIPACPKTARLLEEKS